MIKKIALALVVGSLVMLLAATVYAADVMAKAPLEKIDINSAPAEMLMDLKGIGTVFAERIVAYRSTHGPFEKPEDIMNVDGIGPAIWEKNKDRIIAGSPMANK